jgi:signal transduction histidine kinase
MNRLPLRIRLTAIFALAMGLVLAAAGYLALTRFAESQQSYASRADPAQVIASQRAYADLRKELLTTLPIVFVVAAAGAYLLTAAALRPVERMRAQSEAITETTPDLRLDVPPGRDEIARLATTLNDMLERLQAGLERERRFVADASHELRTPLSLLKTELDLALRRPRSHPELAAALDSAREETERLVDLAEDLLLLARTDQADQADQAPPQADGVARLAPLLDRITARQQAASPATVLTVDCPPQLAVMTGRHRLERALTNLVTNAVQHGDGAVEISARERDGHAEIHIRDHGPGFPAGFLPVAFDRFTRADHARTGGGSGLGLAIVAAISRAAGGSHGAANRPGGGADVWISLPTASDTTANHTI